MELLNKIKKNTFILVIITAVIIFFIVKDDFTNILNTLSKTDYKYIIIAIICYVIYIVLRSYINYLVVNEKDKYSLKESIKHNTIVLFFNGITPFSTGGQPMEIYMLTEHKISLNKATNATIHSFIFYQIALVLLGVFAVIYNFSFHIFPKVAFLRELVQLGFLINILVVVILAVVTLSDKATMFFVRILVSILNKFHLLDKYPNLINNIEEKIKKFTKSSKEILKNKKLLIYGIFINFVGLIFLYIIPYFIICAIGEATSINVIEAITASAYVMVVASFIPIPGASGGIEYSFSKFYINFISKSSIATVLLIWRFITYYLGMIVGALLFSLEKKVK